VIAMQVIILGLLAIALTTVSSPPACGQSSKQKREAGYQTALQAYSEFVKIGATRREVEEALRSKNTPYIRLCCVEQGTTFADLIEIAKEKHPWYCSAHMVYIAIQYVAIDSNVPNTVRETDVVQKVTIWHHLEGCL
jgi:hypothetical protein